MHKVTIFLICFILALQTLVAAAAAPKQFVPFWRVQRGNQENLLQQPSQTPSENSDTFDNNNNSKNNLAARLAKWRQNRQNRYRAFVQRVQDNFPALYRNKQPNSLPAAGDNNKFTVVQYW